MALGSILFRALAKRYPLELGLGFGFKGYDLALEDLGTLLYDLCHHQPFNRGHFNVTVRYCAMLYVALVRA